MRLRDALKLQPGDKILFGHSMWSREVTEKTLANREPSAELHPEAAFSFL